MMRVSRKGGSDSGACWRLSSGGETGRRIFYDGFSRLPQPPATGGQIAKVSPSLNTARLRSSGLT